MVIWFFGLSGSGKSTLSATVAKLYQQRSALLPITLDGDILRQSYTDSLGHSADDRLLASLRMAKIAKVLHDQGHLVICSLVCLYPTARMWISENITSNLFVFIDTSMKTVNERDSKGLYKKARLGRLQDLAGVDLPLPGPAPGDLVITNNGTLPEFLSNASSILTVIKNKNEHSDHPKN